MPPRRPAPATRAAKKAPARRTTPVPRPRRPAKRRSAAWRWRRVLFVAGLATVATTGGIASVLFNIDLPPEDPLRQTSFVCAADVTTTCGPDNAIASFSAEEDRINVPLRELPPILVDAVLATEDRDFFEHGGVDPIGIARAFYNDVRGRGVRQGGSTITQQYVKNVYLSSERSIARKIKEAILAVKLERELEKEEILERYLNTIYFGRGAYGVGAAARAYFGKDVRTIGLPEAAYLAGLIRAPEAADALQDPVEASRRRDTALDALVATGKISGAERDAASALPWEGHVIARRDRTKLAVDPRLEAVGGAYFVDAVQRQLLAKYGEAVLYGGGLRIYTTIDPEMQEDAWDAVTSTLNQPDDPAAALVAIDDRGQVKAMIGGRDFETQKVNYALGKEGGGSGRGAGSAFKPFVLATAVHEGISLNSKFNAPAQITLPRANAGNTDWKVSNYADAEQGVLDLVDATRVSSNTAFAQLMIEVGPDDVVEMAKRLGVEAELPEVNSLVLGTGEVSPLDMATGFSTFANRGVHNDPELIARIEQIDDDGDVTVLEQANPSNDRVLPESEADVVTHALRQVVLGGTGRAANIGKPMAGKTGTTQDNKDAWFVGYTPKLTAAVWMGYPDAEEGELVPNMDDVHGIEVTGGSFPAQIWAKFMRAATQGKDMGSFTPATRFPGRILNPALVLTPDSTSSTSSTTPDPNASSTSGLPGASTTATFPGGGTIPPQTTQPGPTTTLPKCNPPPDDKKPPFPFCNP